jgi:hypothetical protein
VPALQFEIGNCRLLFGFVGRRAEGEGVRGFVKGCASPVDVASVGDVGSKKGREVEKRREREGWGRREEVRRRQRMQIMLREVGRG